MVVGALLTTTLLEPPLLTNWGDVPVLPANVPLIVYVPAFSVGVMEQDPLPLEAVVAVQDWVPFSVSVIVCPRSPGP